MNKSKNTNNFILIYISIFAIICIFLANSCFATNKILETVKTATLLDTEVTETNVQIITDAKDIIISTDSESAEIINDSEIFEHDGKKFKKTKLMGSFKLTGYCACKKCGTGTGITYSGKKVRENHTVAADLKILPIGTYIILEGIEDGAKKYDGIYQVEDKGGGVKNKHIDIYQPTHELASLVTYHGANHANVYIAEELE